MISHWLHDALVILSYLPTEILPSPFDCYWTSNLFSSSENLFFRQELVNSTHYKVHNGCDI